MYPFFNTFLIYGLVMAVWVFSFGPSFAIQNFVSNIHIAIMMLLGSFVAGGTALGGGAVAFPVLTKVVGIPVVSAKIFSLAIQSFGMTAASLTILRKKIKFYPYFVRAGALGSLLGLTISVTLLDGLLPDIYVKIGFTLFLICFALTMIRIDITNPETNGFVIGGTDSTFSFWLTVFVGFIGGLVSGQLGSGADFIVFSLIVLHFKGDIIAATASSVILMAITSIYGSILNYFLSADVFSNIVDYVHAAIPIVVFGAPLGALICLKIHPKNLLAFLLFLIAIECLSTLLVLLLS